jgi:hypothetical protein
VSATHEKTTGLLTTGRLTIIEKLKAANTKTEIGKAESGKQHQIKSSPVK